MSSWVLAYHSAIIKKGQKIKEDNLGEVNSHPKEGQNSVTHRTSVKT